MAIERLKQKDIDQTKEKKLLADGGGLYLQVGEGGRSKSWLFRYAMKTVVKGKTVFRDRNMGLGPLHDITLEQARAKARECRALRRKGIDPLDAQRAEKATHQLATTKIKTLREIAPLFFARFQAKWSPSYYYRARRMVDVYLLPKIGDLPVELIDLQVVRNLLQPIQERREVRVDVRLNLGGRPNIGGRPNLGGGPTIANNVRHLLKQLLEYAQALRLPVQASNPASSRGALGMLLPSVDEIHKTENFPALPINQIGAFMAELRSYRPHRRNRPNRSDYIADRPIGALILEFIALLPVRKHQVLGMKHNEIDWDRRIWTCPKERTKTGKRNSAKNHILPLSDACIAVLEAMRARAKASSEYVFDEFGRNKPYDMSSVGDILRNSLPTRWLDKDGKLISVHGFRATFQSWAIERCGLENARELSELILGHEIRKDMARIYGRLADHSNPLRQMMEQWAQFCDRAEPLPNVLPFTASK